MLCCPLRPVGPPFRRDGRSVAPAWPLPGPPGAQIQVPAPPATSTRPDAMSSAAHPLPLDVQQALSLPSALASFGAAHWAPSILLHMLSAATARQPCCYIVGSPQPSLVPHRPQNSHAPVSPPQTPSQGDFLITLLPLRSFLICQHIHFWSISRPAYCYPRPA